MAALNVMQIAPFLIMDTCYSDMLDPGFLTVTILRQEMAVSLLLVSRPLLQVVEDPENAYIPATIVDPLRAMAPDPRIANSEHLPPICLVTCFYPPYISHYTLYPLGLSCDLLMLAF